jgi:hypothetical protein
MHNVTHMCALYALVHKNNFWLAYHMLYCPLSYGMQSDGSTRLRFNVLGGLQTPKERVVLHERKNGGEYPPDSLSE